MEVEIPTETEPLLGQEIISSSLKTEEMSSSLQLAVDIYDKSLQNTAFDVHGDSVDGRSRGQCCRIFTKFKFALFDSHWPLSCFLAVAFLGVWLPKKNRSLSGCLLLYRSFICSSAWGHICISLCWQMTKRI